MITLKPYGNIRTTKDDKYSVYDLIRVIGGKKNARQTWYKLCSKFPEVGTLCEALKFSGSGQINTPAVDRQGCLLILLMLPDVVGDSYRPEAAKLFLMLEGDNTL